MPPALALPVVCEGAVGEPFIVAIGHQESEDGLYRLLAWFDVVVMVVGVASGPGGSGRVDRFGYGASRIRDVAAARACRRAGASLDSATSIPLASTESNVSCIAAL